MPWVSEIIPFHPPTHVRGTRPSFRRRLHAVCAVCTGDYYPSGSYECLYCTRANAVGTVITIM